VKLRKNSLIEMVRQLETVNGLIEKAGHIVETVSLTDCQEIAIKLGNYMESQYPGTDVTDAVHPLEKYCEFIYQLTIPENCQSRENVRKLTKQIKRTLIAAENGMRETIPEDRKQIVFLPYKASMWDSLESIWMAARDDTNVDTYVIPIPYFDRNPDGSVGEWHYEGDELPAYVPITDWQKYSIPDAIPDVIFIHNPYDDCNYVTSVHPSFYSKELKKYTKCLVYVPYFVLDGNVVGKDFTVIPATVNADYVICQNENEKRCYVNDLREAIPDIDHEKKVLPLGSPKYDRIADMTPENTEIPDMWRKCIEVRNPDMIVLYNSSVGALLRQDGAMYLQKMTDIFNELARQNIFIIWRPHPLMESTLRSMRTDYYELYLKIKTAFTENNMGLIDESADMHPAMLISDMYCGDWSSLVWLYQITGKPIIISEENTQRMQHYNGGNDASANRDYIKVKNVINREFVEFDAYSPKPPEKAGRHIYETIMDKIVKDIK
jgi:hypothetical protein